MAFAQIAKLFPPPEFLRMPAAGVDISDESIKVLRFARHPDGLRVGTFGESHLPPGVVSGGVIVKPDILSEALSRMRRDFGLEFVRLALPEEKAYLFSIGVPDGASERVASAIEFKLEEHVPLSPAEAVFDYDVVGRSGDGTLEVVVSVFPKTVIESYVGVLARARLTPLSFGIEAQAIARAVVRKVPGDRTTRLLVDFGRTRTGIAVALGGIVALTATIGIGGNAFDDAIVAAIGGSRDEADRLKNTTGILPNAEHPDIARSIAPLIAELEEGIREHADYWNAHAKEPIAEMILCGGMANMPGIRERLSSSLSLPSKAADVWTNCFSTEAYIPPIPARESLGYATAVGLALHDGV